MPLFEVTAQGLVPFRQVLPGADLYESEIEDLVWSDLEAFLGETLFPIARQARLTGGGRPDVLALDESGRVVVIEINDNPNIDAGVEDQAGVEVVCW